MSESLQELRNYAESFARKGGDSTLQYFKKSFELEFKEDDSPVTNADRTAERIIRDLINNQFPEHGIIGEEFGEENTDSDVVWVLDPIDGTQSFIHGVPFYTTLIGILIRNQPKVGVIYAPALDEMMSAAIGHGCTLNGKKTNVRACEDLSKATFLSTEVTTFEQYGFGRSFSELLNRTRIHRTWGDAYGHMMVAAGRADIMIDPILNIWDAAALLPIVSESGGAYTDLMGHQSIDTGNGLSTNPILLPQILSIFND
ncbi:histidinol-phosphatase [Rhodohalobacter halophilus]|uniref:histidinol-phosphatase n=1 Tax=Rhodohalobacter halophilus TaxID=1812810 RepID=UPI00083F6E84|nr:histidinol-phosphatase [Rhodohalobacter halophilus]